MTEWLFEQVSAGGHKVSKPTINNEFVEIFRFCLTLNPLVFGMGDDKGMSNQIESLERLWRERLAQDLSAVELATQRDSIWRWLLGQTQERWVSLTTAQCTIAKQAIEYRYRILRERYLDYPPTQAYCHLMNRLGSLVLLREKIRTWVALSRDRERKVADVLQEVIQEMLVSDRHIQGQITWIGKCTDHPQLRNALLLTSVEEYCLRPIRNQPLIAYRFINYLRHQSRAGLTQVPQQTTVRLVSDEVQLPSKETTMSLLDSQGIAEYHDNQAGEEQQELRRAVQQALEDYLLEKLAPVAVKWLRLYLQGRSQEAIAQILDLPIQQIYRLREKVSYHALRVFAIKRQPELVATWLETSLQEHNLGLTPQQWHHFWQGSTLMQQHLIHELKAGHPLAAIAKQHNCKPTKIWGEWTQLYLKAQSLRSGAA